MYLSAYNTLLGVTTGDLAYNKQSNRVIDENSRF